MIRRPSIPLVLVAMAFLTVFAGAAPDAWFCEGVLCSLDTSVCCCLSTTELRDSKCAANTSSMQVQGRCETACDCSYRASSPEANRTRSLDIPSTAAVALLPLPWAPPAVTIERTWPITPAHRIHPPPVSGCVRLRAPPTF